MISQILGHLRVICRLLAVLDRAGEEKRPRRYARTYGPGEIVYLRVVIQLWPIYPDYEDYRAGDVLRGKVSRMKLADCLESQVTELLVGYRTEVSIENDGYRHS